MDIFGQTFVFFVVYDWNHTAAFASLLLGCAAISLPLMPLFGIGMTKLGPRGMATHSRDCVADWACVGGFVTLSRGCCAQGCV